MGDEAAAPRRPTGPPPCAHCFGVGYTWRDGGAVGLHRRPFLTVMSTVTTHSGYRLAPSPTAWHGSYTERFSNLMAIWGEQHATEQHRTAGTGAARTLRRRSASDESGVPPGPMGLPG